MKRPPLQDAADLASRLAADKLSKIQARAEQDRLRARSFENWYSRPLAKGQRESQPRERFFARLRMFELACPKCGEVWSSRAKPPAVSGVVAPARTTTKAPRRAWDPRTHVWTCRHCKLSLQLGLVAHVAPYEEARTYSPEDTIPTLQEARALARRSPLWAAARDLAAKTGESLALVLERMEKETRGLWWKAWGATLRGVIERDRLPKGARINELVVGEAPKLGLTDDDPTT